MIGATALQVALALGGGARALRPRGAHARHYKRGALAGLPSYKLGHDIPVVTHSVVKPLVVTYPPTATVAAVKVPLAHPLLPRHPPRHTLHSAHQHHHHHPKTVLLPHPERHFHHHHHHMQPRPPLPVLPVARPAATVVHSLPPPPSAPIVPAQVTPLLPAATAPVPVAPVLPPAPALVPLAPQYSYILRPGNAVQSSYFATYPRYPLASYRPLAPAPALLLPQLPAVHLQSHVAPPILAVAPTPAFLHSAEIPQAAIQVHNPQPGSQTHIAPAGGQLPVAPHALENDGWAPLELGQPLFTQEAGTQVFEQHDGSEQALGGYQDQLQQHVQQQLEPVHYNDHQLGHESAAPAHGPVPSPEYGQPGHDYDQQLLRHQQQRDHQYSQQYAQHEPFRGHEQQFAEHDQHSYEQLYAQHEQQQQQHLSASLEEQEVQGRSAEERDQRFHNHIPLGLQPPIDRPLEHFR